jgi:hypothetical protein
VAEDLGAPGFTDQVVVVKNAAVGLQALAWSQAYDKVLAARSHQLDDIAGSGSGFINRLGFKFQF